MIKMHIYSKIQMLFPLTASVLIKNINGRSISEGIYGNQAPHNLAVWLKIKNKDL
jgi:hypothetical protein